MKRTTTSQFIAKAKSIHGDKYDYSKVKYEKSSILYFPLSDGWSESYSQPLKELLPSCPIQ